MIVLAKNISDQECHRKLKGKIKLMESNFYKLVRLKPMQDYNDQSCSSMWDGTIPAESSHFQVENEACRFYVERKCESNGGIVSSHIIGYHWLFVFTSFWYTDSSWHKEVSPGLWGLESLWSKVCICCIRINLRILYKRIKNGNVIVVGLMIFRSRFVQMKVPGSLWPDPMGSKV